MTKKENETQKDIFLSADGNFEVSLATKATLYHTGLVEVICQNTKLWLIIILSKCLIVTKQHFHVVEAASYILQLVWDGCWVFPFRRTDLRDEVWQLDLWWVSGKDDDRGNDGQDTGVWPPWFRKGAGTFHSASQSKEGSVGFGTSQHPIFMKLLPDHLWH